MDYDYPTNPENIGQLLRWFDRELKDKQGRGLPSDKFGYVGRRIQHFIKENSLDFKEFKTLLWGVMNDKSEMYSPVYSFYFIDDLEKYKGIKEQYQNREVSNKVEFNKEQVVENNKEKKGEDFFNEL